jgi:hypothetical protein
MIEKTIPHTEFFSYLIQNYRNPFAVQKRKENWQTKRRFVSDYDIQRHLNKTHAIGLNACNYPIFVNFDIDYPLLQEKAVFDLLDSLCISESQRLVITTPSFRKEGSYRVYIRPEYNSRPASFNLLRRFLINKFAHICEIYPQEKRIDRLPFSFGSEIIKDDVELCFLNLEEKLNELLKIDPWEIDFDKISEVAPAWNDKFNPLIVKEVDNDLAEQEEYTEIKNLLANDEIKHLIKNGLEAKHSRNYAQFQILYSLFNSGILMEQAIRQVKSWVKANSNGFSRAVTQQNWKLINAEIKRQAEKIWNDYRRTISRPAQDISFISTVQDLKLAAELFPGDIVKQKQFFNLVAYYRPKAKHEYVFISNKNWRKHIASYKTYKNFQTILIEKGILEADRRYDINNYSQKFRLNLNLQGDVIKINDYNVANFYEGWKVVSNNNLKMITAITGMNKMTRLRHFKS